MSVIAKAIAARQSEIERLQAEIKALNDCRQDPRDIRSGEASGSALLRAAAGGGGHPGRGDPARAAQPTRKRRAMSAEQKKAVSERMTVYWAERRKAERRKKTAK